MAKIHSVYVFAGLAVCFHVKHFMQMCMLVIFGYYVMVVSDFLILVCIILVIPNYHPFFITI